MSEYGTEKEKYAIVMTRINKLIILDEGKERS